MKQKIDRLARGQFDYSLPEIILSENKLMIGAIAGTTFKGSFTVKNSRGSRMKGVAYSSSRLLVLSQSQFIGEENRINYSFIAEFVDPGEKITGMINIVSDCGETELPFEVVVKPPYCMSSIGEIRDLFQLANLAKADWNEAVGLFSSPEFARALPYYDKDLVEVYSHLNPGASKNSALEELLVSIRKKIPVSLSADKDSLEYVAGVYSFLDKVTLTRNTWGYAEYKVYADVPFIRPRNSAITTDMFSGNTFELGIVVEPEKLHAGLNMGRLIIENARERIEIRVVCHNKGRNSAISVQRRRIKQNYCKLEENYLRFRLNRQSVGRYVNEAENILLGLANLNEAENPFVKVYKGHLMLSEGKEPQFQTWLAEMEGNLFAFKKSPVAYAGILYLSAMYRKSPAATERAVNEISALYSKYPEEWMLLWFLLYLDRNYTNPERRFEAVSEAFYQGAKSPVLYYEAAVAINQNPAVLTSLKLFEQQVLRFMVNNSLLTVGTAPKLAFVASQHGEYNLLICRILRKAYETTQNTDLLEALCKLLAAGGRTDAKAHYYYGRAVAAELKIQGIHELYLESAPKDPSIVLERSAINYFTINCSLDDKRKAFLYANIIKHKDEYESAAGNFTEAIKDFTLRKIGEGAIDKNLAVLYDSVIPTLPMTADLASKIPNICFFYEITCNSQDFSEVFISHKEIDGEICIPLDNGHAYIELFTEKAEVIFGDATGRRYISTVDYRLEKLVHLEGLLEQCAKLDDSNPKLVLHIAEKIRYEQREDESSVEIMKQVTRIQGLRPNYVRDYIKELIYYYYDNYEGDMLENYLLRIDLKTLERAERIKIIEFMIIRDLYNVALKAMDEYGFEGIDRKRLQKLCSRLLLNAGGMEKVDVLVAACHYVFVAGRYDETILTYLADYYYGTTYEMFEIWKAARTLEIDTLELEERLLGQMLFAESYVSNAKAVFTNYYRSGTNKTLIRAFLSYNAYKYLVNDRLVEPEIFEIMRDEIRYDENDVCLYAVLKFYSTHEQLTDSEVNFVDYHLNRLEQKGIILPFFRDFKGSMRIPLDIYDKYYIEYRTVPGTRVSIHYLFEDGSGKGYVTEEMKHVCYGIYVKEFVIFANETLQYYITEDTDEGETMMESSAVHLNPEQAVGEDTKYYQLGLIIAAREMQDEKTALKLLDNYIRTDYAIRNLFKPLD